MDLEGQASRSGHGLAGRPGGNGAHGKQEEAAGATRPACRPSSGAAVFLAVLDTRVGDEALPWGQ